ncbi:MAG TPA: hypothetical protein ENL17_03665, partial [Candidatus Methanoperedenaceae archaeon]|nr:hypothetical protein [Candidatus Methanoperedenaceae archaeon]
MRMLRLCLGLLFLGIIATSSVSSTQATNTSNLSTPFFIFGYVCDEHSKDIIVNVTNLNTSANWQAETKSGYNYYELILDPAKISAESVLQFNATDGTTYSTTNHTVDQTNLDHGGIFDLNLTLVSTSPVITEYTPNSPVYDIENGARTFRITIDQMVNVTWLIDGTEVFNEGHVSKSSYTHTNATIGVWNVTTIAESENGTAMQIWMWHVNPPTSRP